MELLKKLTEFNCPSGNEEEISAFIKEKISPYATEIYMDALGNLIAHKKGNGKKLMVTAHTDEIGLIVTNVEESGFLRFAPIGGIDAYRLINKRVTFSNNTVGVISYHGSIDIKKDLNFSKMYIDIGAGSREEAEKIISVGDVCTFSGDFYCDGKRVVSKALDNRIGVYVLMKALMQIKNPAFDLYLVFTSQEEVGIRGAKTSAFSISPDYCIAIDVTDTGDTPECIENPVGLGGGPCVKIMDKSIVCSPKMIRAIKKCAHDLNMDIQNEVLTFGGTDAGGVHTVGEGVVTGALSIPVRYIHSNSETAFVGDIEKTIELATKFCEKNYIE